MLEKTRDFDQQIHKLFIDFWQAYANIIRVELWSTMVEPSISQKLSRLAKICGKNTKSCV